MCRQSAPQAVAADAAWLNRYLTRKVSGPEDDPVRRLLAALAVAALALAAAPTSQAVNTPWFARFVGNAAQVISVVGVGGSQAKMDVWQRMASGWQPLSVGIPAWVGSAGMTDESRDEYPATPKGVFSLDFAFGTAPDPGGDLPYVQVGPDHWWDGDESSPTYNTMQVCRQDECPFDTSAGENLPMYTHAVVMGVNKERIPGRGGAFFLHDTDGGPTAGCVAIDDGTLLGVIRWLRPGALIAVAE